MNLAGKVTAVLAILAVFSAGSIARSAINYTQGMRAARSVQLELSRVEPRDEGNPEVLIAFHLKNGRPIIINLEAFHFSLYLNGNFMGRNYVPFTERILDGFEETTMDFVIPIQPFYLQYIEQAGRKEGSSWSVRGRAKLFLPSKEKKIWLIVREYWRGD